MPPPGPAPARSVEALLRDLGPRLRRGETPAEPLARWPTGIAAIDRILGGGFPHGRLGEITGPPSSGRTSLALALLATTTRAGESVAVVDATDALDPASATTAGVRLERVLWVRAPRLREALRSTELLLGARGFALVLLDLAPPSASPQRIPHASWSRLSRAAASTDTGLIVVSTERAAGPLAELAVELQPVHARFMGTPALLEELVAQVVLVRNRRGSSGHSAPLLLRMQS